MELFYLKSPISIQQEQYQIIFCQIMNSDIDQDHHQLSQSQMYDDLSLFIQIFKRTFNLIEMAVASLQRGSEHVPCIEKIQARLKQYQPLLQKYTYKSGQLMVQQITFHRFICRLSEVLMLYKCKYQLPSSCHFVNCMVHCFQEVEAIVRKFQQEKNICKIIKLVQMSVNKFCINCEDNLHPALVANPCEKAKSLRMTENAKEKERIIPFKKRYDKLLFDDMNEGMRSEQQYEQEHGMEKLFVKDQRKMSSVGQVLFDLQKRYDSFGDLDLDFSSFKTSFFQVKSSTDGFYRSYVQRNTFNREVILAYSDDFYLFQKRKESKKLKRNKLRDNFEDLSLQKYKLKAEDGKQSLKARKGKANKTDGKGLKDKLFGKEQASILTFSQNDTSKVSLKMKHIQITLSKQNIINKPRNYNKSPSVINRKAMASSIASNRESKCNIQVTAAVATRGKFIFYQELDKAIRIKTEQEKESQYEPNHMKTLKDQRIVVGYVSSPARRSIKGKYMYVNCIHKRRDFASRTMLVSQSISLFDSIKFRMIRDNNGAKLLEIRDK